MDIAAFRESLKNAKPPKGLTAALESLWWDAKGDWAKAHESAQQDEGPDGSWVHAYLHRKQGDLSNAKYWYRRADRWQVKIVAVRAEDLATVVVQAPARRSSRGGQQRELFA